MRVLTRVCLVQSRQICSIFYKLILKHVLARLLILDLVQLSARLSLSISLSHTLSANKQSVCNCNYHMRNIKFMTFFSFFSSFRSVCARVRLVLAHFSIHCVATVVQYCQAICKQVDTSASNVIMLILIFASRCVFFFAACALRVIFLRLLFVFGLFRTTLFSVVCGSRSTHFRFSEYFCLIRKSA